MFQDLIRAEGEGRPTREAYNELLRRIESLVVTGGPGIMVRRGPNATTVRARATSSRGGGGANPPFHPTLSGSATDGYKLTFEPGWILERSPKWVNPEDKAIIHHMPEISFEAGTVPMTATPRPSLGIAGGQWAYCNYKTSDGGSIKTVAEDKPRILVDAAEKASVHYTPPDPDGTPGHVGDYWVPLCSFSIVDGKPVITVMQQSDIEHDPYLWAPHDATEGSISLAPKYDEEKPGYVFPRGEAKYGIIMERTGGEVGIEVSAASVDGEGVPVLAPKGPEPDGEPVKFRRIGSYDGAGGNGIRVSLQGQNSEKIEVRGNFFDATESNVALISNLAIKDGLVHALAVVAGAMSAHIKVYRCGVSYENQGGVFQLRVTRSTESPWEIWVHHGVAFGAEPVGFAGSTIEFNAVYHTHVQGE